MASGQHGGQTGIDPTHLRPTSHTALLYEGARGFLDGTVPFLEEGFDHGTPALVMVPGDRFELLDRHFGSTPGPLLHLVRVEDAGLNPAWIIPTLVDFATPHLAEGRAVRGVGEPVHTARSAHEIVECERHESLVDLALAGAGSYDLLCPYDVSALDPEAVDVARRTHDHLHLGGALVASDAFVTEVPPQLADPLPVPPASATSVRFGPDDAWSVRRRLAESAAIMGLDDERLEDLAVVVSEALSNSVEHGGGGGEITWWSEDDRFLCEIRDHGSIPDPLVGRVRPAPIRGNGRGMWLMHQLCDLVQIRVFPDDQKVIRLHLTW